jgi:hypothetical protein
VSEEKRIRYFVRNQQNQPVELHLSSGLIVLGPREEAEVGQAALSEPQMKVFQKQRLVTAREALEPVAGPAEDSAPPPKPRAKSAKSRDEEGGTK